MSDWVVDGVDVRQLTDDVLFAKLTEVGFTPGPIVDSTRFVYQKKLIKILRNEDDEDYDDGGESDGDNEVIAKPYSPFQLPSSRTFSTPPSPYNIDDLRRRPLPRSEYGYESSFVTSPFKRSASPTRFSQGLAAKSSFFTLRVNLALLITAVIFAFLVYQNMESVTTNPVPET